MSQTSNESKVIDCPDQSSLDALAWHRGKKKAVLGSLEGDRLRLRRLPAHVPRLAGDLTHLYLWNLDELSELPELPVGLRCLEVRGCPALASIQSLPPNLETLILQDCPVLKDLPETSQGSRPVLRELSLKGCSAVSESSIQKWLTAAENLVFLDLTGCAQLTAISEWPAGDQVDRIELNECPALVALPPDDAEQDRHAWPSKLRRLGLRAVGRLTQVPQLPLSIDYLDLTGAVGLIKLPEIRDSNRPLGNLRTLFLHGCNGISHPPQAEHGEMKEGQPENVATRIRSFLSLVALAGRGSVKRCKVLFLGNGWAGKTCLARALVGKHPVEGHPGTTFGVEFETRSLERARVGSAAIPVQLSLWDFGGQEIYHNTHRLFWSKGSVFILLWDSSQDGAIAPLQPGGYRDEWRPLRYWLDLIRSCSPDQPRILVVCSKQGAIQEPSPKLKERFLRECPQGMPVPELLCVDPVAQGIKAAREAVEPWLREHVGAVLDQQGTTVPAHWEIAQEMVQLWLDGGHARRETTVQAFLDEWHQSIQEALAADPKHHGKLRGAMEKNQIPLDLAATRELLGFLTRSGWLYWDGSMGGDEVGGGRVIIDQKWALNAIYAVLERTDHYNEFREKGGQFTRQDLAAGVWAGFGEQEQRLFLRYMEAVGLCIPLVTEAQSRWGEPVYLSIEHLKTAGEQGMQRIVDVQKPVSEEIYSSASLHKLHWQAILTRLGRECGKDALYASDGFLVTYAEGQMVFLAFEPNQQPAADGSKVTLLGGSIRVTIGGPNQSEAHAKFLRLLSVCIPDLASSASPSGRYRESSRGKPVCETPRLVDVFISYASDAEPRVFRSDMEPVHAIVKLLKDYEGLVRLRYAPENVGEEKNWNTFSEFMAAIRRPHPDIPGQGRRGIDRFIVVATEKYWRSTFCMCEWMITATMPKERSDVALTDLFLIVDHPTSAKQTHLPDVLRYWKGLKTSSSEESELGTIPQNLCWAANPTNESRQALGMGSGCYSGEKIKEYVIACLDEDCRILYGANPKRYVAWDAKKAEVTLDFLRKALGLSA
jgi:GTPase SAR1 family protein